MTKDEQDILDFLQQQLQWHKEQDLILANIEGKLKAMRALAAYRLAHELPYVEAQRLNAQLQLLKAETVVLEQQLYKGTYLC